MINDKKKKKRKGLMCGTLLSVRVERLTQTVSNPRTRGSEVWSYCQIRGVCLQVGDSG